GAKQARPQEPLETEEAKLGQTAERLLRSTREKEARSSGTPSAFALLTEALNGRCYTPSYSPSEPNCLSLGFSVRNARLLLKNGLFEIGRNGGRRHADCGLTLSHYEKKLTLSVRSTFEARLPFSVPGFFRLTHRGNHNRQRRTLRTEGKKCRIAV